MTTADQLFAHLVYLSVPPVLAYVVLYGATSPWWESWIGRALFTKAFGVLVLLAFFAAFYLFGPHYWGRDYFRIGGMAVACIGFWMALFSLIQVKLEARHDRQPGETWRHHHER